MKALFFVNFLLFSTYPILSQEDVSEINTYLLNAQYQKALELIEELGPTKELLLQKTTCYKALNNYSKAIDILESLSQTYPDDIPVKLELASCYKEMHKYPQGIRCYDELIQNDSTNVYFYIQKADLLYQSQQYHDALAQYCYLEKENTSAYLHKRMGMCYEKLNQTDSAIAHYARSLEIEPEDNFTAINLVKMYIKQEDFKSAIDQSESFIARDPSHGQMNLLNAFAYYSSDQYEEAIKRFEKCLNEGDSTLMVNQGLGISYYFLENNEKAQPYLNQAYNQDTTNLKVLYPLAITSYETGLYKEAIEYYTTLLRSYLPNKKALFNLCSGLAKAYEKEGKYQETVENYGKSLQYAGDGEEMEILYHLANLFEHQLNNYGTAVFYFQQYRLSLFNFQMNLKDPEEVEVIEEKLQALDEHIKDLKSR